LIRATEAGRVTARLSGFGSSIAFHVLATAVILSLAGRSPRVFSGRDGANTIAAFIAGPPEDVTFPGLNAVDAVQDQWTFQSIDDPSAPAGGAFDFDVKRIAERAQVLFPFLTPGLSLEHLALTPPREIHKSLDTPFATADASQPTGVEKPPLALGDSALQAVVDKAWSRRDRWVAFQRIIKLTGEYSAESGQLPSVLRAYVDQNWLQPYADGSIRDPRLWSELSLAADHASFVGFIRQYVSEHPSTRAATELLFLLDKMVQASRNALATLLATNPVEQLAWTRTANRHAYDLIVAIRRYYTAHLERRGLTSAEAIDAFYARVRLTILNGILRSTPDGYRANDARFLIGEIDWKGGKTREALESWRELSVDQRDSYATECADLLRIVHAGDARAGADHQPDRVLKRQIEGTLDSRHGRWLMFSFDRLRRFGYRFDTF
jgi:hypothetical protein